MSMGQLLASGAAAVFNPGMFLMVCVAIILGTIFGALPGVSATMAVALGLTFTYTMEPIPAIVFLVAIYCSSITGGSITAILFKIPGVPSSAPTTFDGYPMAQRGEAGKALTETEIRTLPDGAKLMTFEVGIRFLADYLNGDVYFKTKYPQHNLDRARNQFHLVAEMEAKRDETQTVVDAYL